MADNAVDEDLQTMDQRRQIFESVSKNLDITFKDTNKLIQAFSHPSYIHENDNNGLSYQRLEFLGDAVLDLIVSELLILEFPQMDEGNLSKIRSKIVNEKTLADLARSIKLGEYILLGKGENQNLGSSKDSILSDVFESLIGGLYLDSGLQSAKVFFIKVFNDYIRENEINLLELSIDFKSKLQEEVMKKLKITPTYTAIEVENGFKVSLLINGKTIDTSIASSKKKAEKILAKQVYKNKTYLN